MRLWAAIAGESQDVAIGLPPGAGLALWDDFTAPPVHGALGWQSTLLGTAPPPVMVDTARDGEVGLWGLQSGTGNGTAILSLPGRAHRLLPGMIFAAKYRAASDPSSSTGWFGLSSSALGGPPVATVNDGVILRLTPDTTGRVVGVCVDGANETTQAIDDYANIAAWRTQGFEVTPDGEVQFFVVIPDDRRVWARRNIGAPVATNIPDGVPLYLCAGYGGTVADRAIVLDWIALGGRTRR
jgi:hypothetical protein